MEQTNFTSYQFIPPSIGDVINFFKENGIEEPRYAQEWFNSMVKDNWSYKGKKLINWRKFSRFTIDRLVKYNNSVQKEALQKPSKKEPEMILAQNIHKMYYAYNGYQIDAYTTEIYKLLKKVKEENKFESEALISFVEDRLEGLKDFDYKNVERLLLE